MNDENLDAINASELSSIIAETIFSKPDLMKYAPDALMRVYVSLYVYNGRSLEYIKEETIRGIEYYYKGQKERMDSNDY